MNAGASNLVGGRRALTTQDLVDVEPLDGAGGLPLVMRPRVPGVRAAEWAAAHADRLSALIDEHGAVLLRGFDVPDRSDFEAFVAELHPSLAEYDDGHTPRSAVGGGVYTSTEYPASQTIEQHSEMSYSRSAPQRVFFHCRRPATSGGATPIADNRRMLECLPELVRNAFLARRVRYLRNYYDGIGLPWQRAFQSDERSVVERRLRHDRIEFEWSSGGGLRLRHDGPAVIRHPRTGKLVWFNQAHAFHTSSLPPGVRESVVATYGEEGAPNHALFGDGSPIPNQMLAAVRRAYDEVKVEFPWQRGDILALDNVLVSHGRTPYGGEREVLVAMAEPFTVADYEMRLQWP